MTTASDTIAPIVNTKRSLREGSVLFGSVYLDVLGFSGAGQVLWSLSSTMHQDGHLGYWTAGQFEALGQALLEMATVLRETPRQ